MKRGALLTRWAEFFKVHPRHDYLWTFILEVTHIYLVDLYRMEG